MRCPKCDALAADTDPRCIFCGKRLNHVRSAPRVPGQGPQPGGPPGVDRLAVNGVGAVLMTLGMVFGMWAADGADTAILQNLIKPVIAAGVCCGFPLLGLWFVVRLSGGRR